MIPKFSGPETITSPNARFLYNEFETPNLAWENFIQTNVLIDELIESHPRLEKAHEHSFVVFFDGNPKTWVGREIIGHRSSWPAPFKTFDSYKGEAFQWEVETRDISPSMEDILSWKSQLTALAPSALAPTWRICISPMECLNLEVDDAVSFLPNISFQFFKSH